VAAVAAVVVAAADFLVLRVVDMRKVEEIRAKSEM
jgi:hypothetical protein